MAKLWFPIGHFEERINFMNQISTISITLRSFLNNLKPDQFQIRYHRYDIDNYCDKKN